MADQIASPDTNSATTQGPNHAVTQDLIVNKTRKPILTRSRLLSFLSTLRSWIFRYFTFHVLYFSCLCVAGGGILWAMEDIDYIDGLFMATSAFCVTGLSTVDFSAWAGYSQVAVMIFIHIGSSVLMSMLPLILRLFYITIFANKQGGSLIKQLSYTREFRILSWLVIFILMYFIGIEIFFFLLMSLYLQFNHQQGYKTGINNPWYWGIFHSISAFNNAGFALNQDNLVAFQEDELIVLSVSFLTAAGNTAFPILFRFQVWVIAKLFRRFNRTFASDMDFLLFTPRKFFTNMFGMWNTWILFVLWWVMTLGNTFLFMALSWNDDGVYPGISDSWKKILISFGQTVYVRTSGFNIVDLSQISPALMVAQIFMMYISNYPLFITIQESAFSEEEEEDKGNKVVTGSGVQNQLKRVLLRDAIYLYLAMLIIEIIEDDVFQYEDGLSDFSLRLLYEIISAYGTVGLTIGWPGYASSFSSGLRAGSKFIMCLVMLLGRHRGLPSSVDRAVRVVGKKVEQDKGINIDGHDFVNVE